MAGEGFGSESKYGSPGARLAVRDVGGVARGCLRSSLLLLAIDLLQIRSAWAFGADAPGAGGAISAVRMVPRIGAIIRAQHCG